jgi:hypothetical protein
MSAARARTRPMVPRGSDGSRDWVALYVASSARPSRRSRVSDLLECPSCAATCVSGTPPPARHGTASPCRDSAKTRQLRTSTRAERTTACRRRLCGARWVGARPARETSMMRDHSVDDPVLARLVRRHEVVALHVLRDPLERLARVLGDDLFQAPLDADYFARLDLDIGCLPFETAGDLVEQSLRVWQRRPLPLRAAGEEQAPIDIAIPTHVVWMSGLTNCIAS